MAGRRPIPPPSAHRRRGKRRARGGRGCCRFQKTTSVVTRRALQHAGIGTFIADQVVSTANHGWFRGPGAALAGDSDDLGRAGSMLNARQAVGPPT